MVRVNILGLLGIPMKGSGRMDKSLERGFIDFRMDLLMMGILCRLENMGRERILLILDISKESLEMIHSCKERRGILMEINMKDIGKVVISKDKDLSLMLPRTVFFMEISIEEIVYQVSG
jgi:hypothetical protein